MLFCLPVCYFATWDSDDDILGTNVQNKFYEYWINGQIGK